MKYAHENGCPWDADTCMEAAENGNLECLIYAHEHGCHWDEYTCYMAAKNGHLNCLKYAHENGCSCDIGKCLKIAKNIDVINFLKKNKKYFVIKKNGI